MTIPILATVIRLLWILFEYPYLRRHRIKPAKDWDRHSARLWDAANLIEPIGMLLGFTSIGRIQTATNIISYPRSSPGYRPPRSTKSDLAKTLIGAISQGANIPEIISLLEAINSSTIWQHYASLGEKEASFVLLDHPELIKVVGPRNTRTCSTERMTRARNKSFQNKVAEAVDPGANYYLSRLKELITRDSSARVQFFLPDEAFRQDLFSWASLLWSLITTIANMIFLWISLHRKRADEILIRLKDQEIEQLKIALEEVRLKAEGQLPSLIIVPS